MTDDRRKCPVAADRPDDHGHRRDRRHRLPDRPDAATIRQESEAESVTFIQADHATVGGNQDLAEQVSAAVPRLAVLVNNVGGLYPTGWETADGYEAMVAMNFVGPYVLTAELLPLLRAGGPRCVSVVSAGFKLWKPAELAAAAPTSGHQPMQHYGWPDNAGQ